jgi:hypothetical protein
MRTGTPPLGALRLLKWMKWRSDSRSKVLSLGMSSPNRRQHQSHGIASDWPWNLNATLLLALEIRSGGARFYVPVHQDAFRHRIWEKTRGIATATIVVLGLITSLALDIRASEQMAVGRTHDVVERLRQRFS